MGFFRSGPITRTRAMQKRYRDYIQRSDTSICYFCNLDEAEAPKPMRQYAHFYVAPNQFGYALWDACKVVDHLLLIPNKHRVGLASLNTKELNEMAKIIAEYETKGYTFYGRATETVTGSVAHQHTHLVKLERQRRSWIVYLRKPHVLLSK